MLRQGVEAWNAWRKENPISPDLSGADLSFANLKKASLWKADFSGANLDNANLSRADLGEANLWQAFLTGAILSKASLLRTNLYLADFSGADLNAAGLTEANLHRADFSGANLKEAVLYHATLVETNFTGANLSGCYLYGASIWNVTLDNAKQDKIVINNWNEPVVTVDNLEVAQFIYLMLNNDKVRSVLEAITTKSVLILGRFSEPMKDTLDAIRNKLREMDYLPIMFDFERLSGQDYTETIRVLAGMSKFVIADLSGAKSIQQELQAIIPDFELPVVPIIQKGEDVWSMFESHEDKDYVLPIVEYRDTDHLIKNFGNVVVRRAEKLHHEIIVKKSQHQIKRLSVDDVLDEDG